MSLSFYDACVPVLVRQLRSLASLLDKGEAHATEAGIDPATLIDARLAPDMFPLARQVQIASDMAKGGAARLGGQTPPPHADDETSFADLKARVAKTIAFIESVPADAFEGAKSRPISMKAGENELHFTGRDYLFDFVLPNVFFHLTTTYALLRHHGVPVGKRDYLGWA